MRGTGGCTGFPDYAGEARRRDREERMERLRPIAFVVISLFVIVGLFWRVK
jgi:hypothetical protein